ncbi:hypothetical protein J7643_11570 [bacterium]|nr:hypothetical protein [bacterium]
MAMIDGNGNPQRLGRPTGPIKPRTLTLDSPPEAPKSEAAAKPKTDRLKVENRPTSDQDRLKAAVAAAQAAGAAAPAANGGKAKAAEAAKPKEEDKPVSKTVADAVGAVDGLKEGVKIASNIDELEKLPLLGRLMQRGGRAGSIGGFFARSRAGAAIAHAMENGKYVAPMVKGLGRVAPIAGAVVAGFDIADAVKTNKDPKASGTEKVLANAKAGLSALSAAAGTAALFLAPTGIGGAIAGGIALGAGLLSMGADLMLGKVRNDRKKAEQH